MTTPPNTPPRKPRGAKTAAALVTVAILTAIPFVMKRGCHFSAGKFSADFDPVSARTNSSTTNTPPAVP